MLKSQESTTQR